ncbi:MAG: autotransporter outer membrane beta-barrel domain-containing protein [Candidatus Rokuibacteriota bacterium]
MSRVSTVSAVLVALLTVGAAAEAQDAPLVQAAENPTQRGVAVVVAPPGTLCPELVTQFPTVGGARGDLRDRCTELVVSANNPAQLGNVQAGLQAMSPDAVTAQGTSFVETSVLRLATLAARLASLRAGGSGTARPGIALDGQEGVSTGILVASVAPGGLLTAAPAPADQSDRLGFFLTGHFATGDKDATDREAGFDFDAGSLLGGVDYRFTRDLVLGAAVGYSVTNADLAGSRGSVDVDGVSLSLYGTHFATNRFFVDGIVSGGFDSYDTSRNIRYAIPGVGGGTTEVNQTARGDTDGPWFVVGAGAGYDVTMGGLTFGPLARVSFAKAYIDGYQESISGTGPGSGLALDVDSQDVDSLQTVLGAQASYAIGTGFAVLVPHVRAEWVHEFLDDSRTISARFVEDPTPSAGTTIRLVTDDPDRDYFNVGVGLSATFRRGISAFVYYETALALADVTAHKMGAGFRFAF